MTGESGGSGLTQKAIHPNVFRLNPDRLCEIAVLVPKKPSEHYLVFAK